ncbi:MAG: hypothetical protein COB29_12700 [Sulfitobacter sp.]|nr:MAG: hypothetical protein COB29_12700 [Sulfitobacter sp.]
MKNENGFTLIEVLIAFAILSISLATLYMTFSSSFIRSSHLQAEQRAFVLAREKLADIPITSLVQPYEEKYEVEGYTVQIIVSDSTENAPLAIPVVVAVTWQSRTGEQELVIRTYRLSSVNHE